MPNLSEKIPVRRLMLVAVGTLMTSLLIPVVSRAITMLNPFNRQGSQRL